MDASLKTKVDELLPYVQQGLIVDAGFGTGSLLEVLTKKFPKSEFVGVDISPEFILRAKKKFAGNKKINISRGDIRFLEAYGIKDATTVIHASILHEVHSYNGYDETPVHRALRSAYEVLVSGGRLLIRDGIAPSRATVALWCNNKDGKSKGKVAELSTRAMFKKFVEEYRQGVGVLFDEAKVAGKDCYVLRARDAYEFMAKKDYRTHWDLEIHEEYGFWREREWLQALKKAGFKSVDLQEKNNDWIIKNRWQGSVELYDPVSGKKLDYFPTHAVFVAEK